MEGESIYKKCQASVSEIEGTSTTKHITWKIRNWKDNLDTLKNHAICKINFEPDHKTQISLLFGEVHSEATQKCPRHPGHPLTKRWLPLMTQIDLNGNRKMESPIVLSVTAHELSTSGKIVKKLVPTVDVSFACGDNVLKKLVYNTFVELSSHCQVEGVAINNEQPDELLLGVSVKLQVNNPVNSSTGVTATAADVDLRLSDNLKEMYESENNYSDLKLETRDSMTLSAHKFILAARSRVLRQMIEDETKKEDFSGTIKLVDVDAKPMLAILYWMYTGEVYEKAGLVMEQVINTAMKFQLSEMLKILDKKMISVCTPENMFVLFQTAKKCGMLTAVEDLTVFIKENL